MFDCKTEYIIKNFDDKTAVISVNDSLWDLASVGFVECENWSGFSKAPKTEFRILRGKSGLYVRMHTAETDLRCEIKEQNGNVFQDSCMEFFLTPDIRSKNYLNFEFNPAGILHLGFGENRFNRLLIDVPRDIFRIAF